MSKSNFKLIACCLFSLYVFPAFSNPCEITPSAVDWEDSTFIDIQELDKYQDAYLDLEEAIARMDEMETCEYDYTCGNFLSKWNNKVKRWVRKRCVNAIKCLLQVRSGQGPDTMAYTVIHVKKKLDKYAKTGSIESITKRMRKHAPPESLEAMQALSERIEYLYYHPEKKEGGDRYNFQCRKPEYNGELDHIPPAVMFAGIEIGIGAMLCGTGFPPFVGAGWWFIDLGMVTLVSHYVLEPANEQYRENQKDKSNE